jgi:hypothetical protein
MTTVITRAAVPVELLRDRRGVYGIGVCELFDFEAAAWSCGIEPKPHTFEGPGPLILRPDRLPGTRPRGAVLQKITGGFRRGPFMRSHEEQLRKFIHHEALNRAGLRWPPRHLGTNGAWWSTNKKQQQRNRGTYHGLRLLSLHTVNHLIGVALEAAADADAIRAARRFAFRHRESIYRAAVSRRALQLADTFPILALALYTNDYVPRLRDVDFRKWETKQAEMSVRRSSAARLVERGARLRDVAAAMGVPMALRHIRPGVAHLASEVLWQHPELLRAMPDTMPSSRIWLRVVPWAHDRVGAEFAEWTARHASKIPGNLSRVGGVLGHIADWVRAGITPEVLLPWDDPTPRAGSEFIVRPFTPSMSLKTVIALSADWHEAVANNLDGPNSAFPPPWYPAARLSDYEILPIEDADSLYREGTAMHHCVGTYGEGVQRGYLYIYSIRRNGERVATLALGCHHGQTWVEQIRGPCNSDPPEATVAAVVRWLHTQRTFPGVKLKGEAAWAMHGEAAP